MGRIVNAALKVKALREERKSRDLCTYCAKPANGKAKCETCRSRYRLKDAERARNKRAVRKSQGLCLDCGTVPCNDKPRCDRCIQRRREISNKRHHEMKTRAVAMFDNKCGDCGFTSEYAAVFDFHHIDPSEKHFNPARLISWGKWEELIAELKKCIMLCANCHRIRHAKEGTEVD